MKITDVSLFPVRVRLPRPLRWGQFEVLEKGAVLLRIDTDEGLYGVGECGLSVGFYSSVSAVIERLRPLLIGEDPLAIGRLWERMYSHTHLWGRRGVETYALSGVDIALWDLAGKAAGMPIHRMLGTVKEDVEAYFAPSLKPPEVIEREAVDAVERGFKAIKLRVGMGERNDLEIVRRVRKAVGEKITIMVDANMAYDLKTAKEMGRRFAEYNIFWLEEPVRAHSLSQYVFVLKEMSNAVPYYVAGGECLFTKYEFLELISKRAVDVVQPDCTTVGGITEAHKIAACAEMWDLMFVPHVACSSIATVGLAAALHVIAASTHSRFIEYDPYETELRRRILANPLVVREGRMRVPEGPGLGIEIDWEAVKHYSAKC